MDFGGRTRAHLRCSSAEGADYNPAAMLAISRYINRQLLVGMIMTGLGLACVLWLTQSLRFVELIVNKGLSILGFLQLTVMLLPNFLAYILPVSLFAVTVFVYNKMTTDREIVVLRSIGLSNWALARPAVTLALAATLFGYLVTLWVSPASNRAFREHYFHVRNDLSSLLIQEGSFNRLGSGLTLFVRFRTGEGELREIMLHDTRDKAKAVTTMAERGVLMNGPYGPRVLLENGNRQEAETGTGRLSMLYFDSYAVDFGLSPASAEKRNIDARERPIGDLLTLTGADGFEPVQIRQFRSEAHQRLTAPLLHLAFAMIALAALLSGTFNRRGQLGRILAATGLMVAVQAGALGAASLVAKNGALVPLLYVNAIVPIVASAYVLLGPPARRLSLPRRPSPAP